MSTAVRNVPAEIRMFDRSKHAVTVTMTDGAPLQDEDETTARGRNAIRLLGATMPCRVEATGPHSLRLTATRPIIHELGAVRAVLWQALEKVDKAVARITVKAGPNPDEYLVHSSYSISQEEIEMIQALDIVQNAGRSDDDRYDHTLVWVIATPETETAVESLENSLERILVNAR